MDVENIPQKVNEETVRNYIRRKARNLKRAQNTLIALVDIREDLENILRRVPDKVGRFVQFKGEEFKGKELEEVDYWDEVLGKQIHYPMLLEYEAKILDVKKVEGFDPSDKNSLAIGYLPPAEFSEKEVEEIIEKRSNTIELPARKEHLLNKPSLVLWKEEKERPIYLEDKNQIVIKETEEIEVKVLYREEVPRRNIKL